MMYRGRDEIRIIADKFREKCVVSGYGIADLHRDCEKEGFKIIRYPIGENADLGFTMKKDGDIIIFTNTSIRLSRELFTLAHEIGHALLHLGKSNSFVDNSKTVFGRSEDEREIEANYFAACLLMPKDKVSKFFDLELSETQKENLTASDIASIMSAFNVSFEMVLNRLESLEIIDINQRTLLDNEKNEKRVGNLLRSVGGNARLNVITNEISLPHEYIDYVIFNYNHNAVPKETLEAVLTYYHLTIEDVSDRLVELTSDDEDDLDDLIGGS